MAIDIHLYFAWVDPTDTTYSATFARNDETTLGFSFEHREGEFATLQLTVNGSGVSYLSALRKTWGWFSYRLDTELIPVCFCRLDAVQAVNSDDGPVSVLNFIAEPIDYLNQKKTVADALRVLPRYDRAFIDQQSWEDDDIVLEGYPLRYHFDPVTHAISTSDILIGEDGFEEFQVADTRYSGFSMELTNKPAAKISVNARLNWTQRGQGSVNLSSYFVSHWPGAVSGAITSYTFNASSWPGVGSSIGSGWNVLSSSCDSVYDLTVKTVPFGYTVKSDWSGWGVQSQEGDDGVLPTTNTTSNEKTTLTVSGSDEKLKVVPPDSISLPRITTDLNIQTTFDRDGEMNSYSKSETSVEGLIPLNYLRPSLVASWKANRSHTEVVTVTLASDIQPVIGSANQGQSLDTIALETSDLSETIGEGTDGEIPIGDARNRSYICTTRGQLSLQYIIARAQSALLFASRAVEITFSPYIGRMRDISLRKNARIHRGEIPGGVAEGKIIAYRMDMPRNSGSIDCSITIGCAIGHGGEITEVDGVGTYIEDDYIEDGHFEETGGVELFDSSVGYTPPLFNPNDDGLDLIAGFSAASAFEEDLEVENSAGVQRAALEAGIGGYQAPFMVTAIPAFVALSPTLRDFLATRQQIAEDRETFINNLLASIATTATFKLKPMNRQFESPYEIETTGLKIPTMINLES